MTAADRALAYPNENPHGRIDFHRSSVETKVGLHSYTNSYTTHLVVVLLFLEVVGDVALVLTELFLGVTKFPCYRQSNLSEWESNARELLKVFGMTVMVEAHLVA